jgi:hypothetical protein
MNTKKTTPRAKPAVRPRRTESATISGQLLQFVFSPKGGIEGLLLDGGDAPTQITVPIELGNALTRALHVGGTVTVRIAPKDESDNDERHPVHRGLSVMNGDGTAIAIDSDRKGKMTLQGTIARVNYAKRGEPNGVVLENGNFIHLKPRLMKRSQLAVGDEVSAVGKPRPHVLGGVVLEAASVNGKKLGKL